jgi:hypothetical protein
MVDDRRVRDRFVPHVARLCRAYTLHVTELVLDRSRSRARIQTFAEGLLSRMAHDLELTCEDLSGTATRDEGGAKGSASIRVPVMGIQVVGVLRNRAVDRDVLSSSDSREIQGKMRREVFQAGAGANIELDVEYAAPEARLRMSFPNGRTVTSRVRADVTETDGIVRVRGDLDVSLSSIGSAVVRGPMGAFRVRDRVQIAVDLYFVPARSRA